MQFTWRVVGLLGRVWLVSASLRDIKMMHWRCVPKHFVPHNESLERCGLGRVRPHLTHHKVSLSQCNRTRRSGMHCLRDASSRGCIVQWTQNPGDTKSQRTIQGHIVQGHNTQQPVTNKNHTWRRIAGQWAQLSINRWIAADTIGRYYRLFPI